MRVTHKSGDLSYFLNFNFLRGVRKEMMAFEGSYSIYVLFLVIFSPALFIERVIFLPSEMIS